MKKKKTFDRALSSALALMLTLSLFVAGPGATTARAEEPDTPPVMPFVLSGTDLVEHSDACNDDFDFDLWEHIYDCDYQYQWDSDTLYIHSAKAIAVQPNSAYVESNPPTTPSIELTNCGAITFSGAINAEILVSGISNVTLNGFTSNAPISCTTKSAVKMTIMGENSINKAFEAVAFSSSSIDYANYSALFIDTTAKLTITEASTGVLNLSSAGAPAIGGSTITQACSTSLDSMGMLIVKGGRINANSTAHTTDSQRTALPALASGPMPISTETMKAFRALSPVLPSPAALWMQTAAASHASATTLKCRIGWRVKSETPFA